MRNLAADMDLQIIQRIDTALDKVANDEQVKIPWAIESGSRAWGFPSPDSDYDCRFVYVRPSAAYLTPWPMRDVIELPMDQVFDVNGWDLIKAVRLLVKGNAVVTEWLRSPLVYRGDTNFRDEFLQLAAEVADPARTIYHHLHVGQLQWTPDGNENMKIKRLLYSTRAAATLSWLRYTGGNVPPMDLPTLLREAAVAAPVQRAALDLIERKQTLVETAPIAVPPVIHRYVHDEFAWAARAVELHPPLAERDSAYAAAKTFFRHIVLG